MALFIITAIALAFLCAALVAHRVVVHRRHALADRRETARARQDALR